MPRFDDLGLSPRRRAKLDAALADDPLLSDELELFDSRLPPESRRLFWETLADRLRAGRPAGAVLGALERVARRES